MKKHAFRIGLVVTMLLGLMMISANAAPTANCAGDHTSYTPWTPTGGDEELPAGTYYLTDNATVGTISTDGDVTICLNGHTLTFASGGTASATSAERGFQVGEGETLSICDCSTEQTGTITSDNVSGKYLQPVYVTKGTFNLFGGSIANVQNGYYGSAMILRTNATFNMYGGSLTGNRDATDGGAAASANIYIYEAGATVNITGGTIEPGGSARAVHFNKSATLNISGADTVVKGNITKGSNTSIKPTSSIAGGTFGFDPSTHAFLTVAAGYAATDNGDGTYTVTVVEISGGENIHGDGTLWLKYVPGETTLQAGGLYYLAEDVTADAQIILDKSITLCLCGHTLEGAPDSANGFVLRIPAGVTVNLQDCGGQGDTKTIGTLKPADSSAGSRGVIVASGGTLNMYGGTITGFTNTGTNNGGGVQLNGGTMNMYGGTITGNHADSAKGGGVYAAAGSTLNIFDGTISNNTADLGGGIGAVGSTATVRVSGGTISNNEAKTTDSGSSNGGGGIYIDGGTVNLTGGVLTGNSALYGGAVRANNYGKVNVSGDVKIYGNTATNAGAALCLFTYGTITISGGYIYSNVATPAAEADAYGAAIAIRSGKSDSKLTISGSACIGVDATGAAAANYCEGLDNSKGSIACVYDSSGTYTVTGGTFYANEGDTLFGSYDNNGVTDTGAVQVSGGSFSKTIGERNLADGYHDYALAENESKVCPYVVDEKFAPSSVKLLVQDKNGFGLEFLIKQADVPGDIADDYTVAFSNGETADYSPTTVSGTSYYRYRFRGIAAKDMGDEVTLTFTNNDKAASSATFSIKEYATQVLETSSDDALKQAVSDMLRYGAAAQSYFQPEETVVTNGMDLVTGSNYTPANKADLTADENKLYMGSALSLKNNIVLNLYFDSSVTGVSVGGVDMSSALEEQNGYKVVKFSNTDVLKLSTVGTELEIVITAGEGEPITISDSVEAYAYRATQLAGEDKLTALCQAMMNFVASANAYLAG